MGIGFRKSFLVVVTYFDSLLSHPTTAHVILGQALIIGLIVLFWFYDAGAFQNSSEGAVVFTFYTFVILPFVASEEALKGMFVRMQHKKVARAAAAAATAAGGGGGSGGGNSSGSGRMVDEVTRQHLIHSTATSVGYALSQAMGWVVITHLVVSSNSQGYASSLGAQVVIEEGWWG
jgi:hypothetical protein